MSRPALTLLFVTPYLFLSALHAKDKKPSEPAATSNTPHKWADWIEPDFPFFSSVLDARDAGKGFPKDNLTPRGLILNLGHNLWACFDTDLLRIACIWQGEEGKPPVTQNALAPGSYQIAGQKTKDGQEDLPKPVGKVWLANGIYPGWQVLKSPDDKPSFVDPREPGPDKKEVGKGALDEKIGRFLGVHFTNSGPILEYEIAGIKINQAIEIRHDERTGVNHVHLSFGIAPHTSPMTIVFGKTAGGVHLWTPRPMPPKNIADDPLIFSFLASVKRAEQELTLDPPSFVAVELKPSLSAKDDHSISSYPWPQTVTTKATLSQKDDAYVVDDIPLPLDNPWKRNVRLADIAFLDEKGNAAAVTFDGDVWLITGLVGDLKEVKWRRFASGLHEPMSIVARPRTLNAEHGTSNIESGNKPTAPPQGKDSMLNVQSSMFDVDLFVFDRNGIWRLRDTNNDGEADAYEMFCNRFAQTAESREFPSSMKLAPDGSFIISKGGQQGTYLGKHNGTVIRVSPDGKSYEVMGYGLRQPFVGVHPKTGLVVASDQEGNYVPTTPIHIIKDHQFYGFLAAIQPKEKYPQGIADPLTWIPHSVVPSSVTLTWLTDAKMGSANDNLVLVSYNKPELHRVLVGRAFSPPSDLEKGLNALPTKPQAAVVPWIKNLDFPTLNAHVNPADGQLYATGFQIWGTTVQRISGLARIRYTGKPCVLLTECTPCDKGLLMRFNLPLDKSAAANPDNFNVERWNYQRTSKYGSPHLKGDGTPGQEWMVPSSAYLSKDGRSVFIGLPDMKNTYMQMRVGYGLKSEEGLPAQESAYLTPYELVKFEPEKEGFGNITVDLTPRKMVAAAAVKPTQEEGKRLYEMMGCIACHSIDGTVYGKVGPSWKGLYGSERILAKGGDKAVANDAYIKESIINPSAKVVKGYEKLDAGMPIYNGVLNDSQIESLILFIKSLR